MGIEKTLIQPEPVISAIINGDNTGILKIDGEEHPYEAPDVDGLRQALMKRVIGEAATLGRPVRVTSMDDTGVSYLVVAAIAFWSVSSKVMFETRTAKASIGFKLSVCFPLCR